MSEKGGQQSSNQMTSIEGTGLRQQDLNIELFTRIAHALGLTLISWQPFPMLVGESIATEKVMVPTLKDSNERVLGFYAFDIKGVPIGGDTSQGGLDPVTVPVVLRSKPPDNELLDNSLKFYYAASKEEGDTIELSLIKHTHKHDIAVAHACMADPVLQQFNPQIYHVVCDEERGVYLIVMEYLGPDVVTNMGAIEGVSKKGVTEWGDDAVDKVLRDLAIFHSLYLDDLSALPESLHKIYIEGALLDGVEMFRLLNRYSQAIAKVQPTRFPQIWGPEEIKITEKIVANLSYIQDELDKQPKTLIHGDFSARNICLRKTPSERQRHLCMLDWEMAAIHVPQRDLAEFLAFSLPFETPLLKWSEYINIHRTRLTQELRKNQKGDDLLGCYEMDTFLRVLDFCMMEFLVARLPVYISMGTGLLPMFQYVPRTLSNVLKYLMAAKSRHSFLQN